MKIGYTLNPIDINEIVKVTDSDRFPEVALGSDTLHQMLKHVGVYGIIIGREEGELVGFAILNCSYWYEGRIDIAHFYMTEKYRGNRYYYTQKMYDEIERLLRKCKVNRLQAHTNNKRVGKMLRHVGFKKEARLQSWCNDREYTQYYKLLGR